METTIPYWLTLSLLLLAPLRLLLLRYSAPPSAATNHCPSTLPVIGNLVAFLRNRHRFLDWASDLLSAAPGHTIEVRGPILSSSHGVCTADPAGVDHLLRTNFPNYVKGRRSTAALSDLLGRGIFNAESHLWAVQRKVASREFTTRSLRSFVSGVVRDEIQSRLIPLLSKAADGGNTLDLQDVLRRFSFDTICAIAFGTNPVALHSHPDHHHDQQDHFFHAFDDGVEISSSRLFSPAPWIWKAKRFLNVGSERRLRSAIQSIDEYASCVIASKEEEERHQQQKQEDLLSRFMMAVKEDELSLLFKDEAERRRFLRDIVVSFVLAGKDSTSSALTWFFWLLSMNRLCERRILAEIGDGSSLEYEELKGMHYLHAAISEAMRLYPPVPMNSRVAVAEDELPDGTQVGAGWFADYSAYAMGRSEAVWGEDCRDFVPERWLRDGKGEFVPADPSRFPVFHAGPRTCLGREMAYVQMKAAAAAVIRDFEIVPATEAGGGMVALPQFELSLTLRMKGGFPVKIKERVKQSVIPSI